MSPPSPVTAPARLSPRPADLPPDPWGRGTAAVSRASRRYRRVSLDEIPDRRRHTEVVDGPFQKADLRVKTGYLEHLQQSGCAVAWSVRLLRLRARSVASLIPCLCSGPRTSGSAGVQATTSATSNMSPCWLAYSAATRRVVAAGMARMNDPKASCGRSACGARRGCCK